MSFYRTWGFTLATYIIDSRITSIRLDKIHHIRVPLSNMIQCIHYFYSKDSSHGFSSHFCLQFCSHYLLFTVLFSFVCPRHWSLAEFKLLYFCKNVRGSNPSMKVIIFSVNSNFMGRKTLIWLRKYACKWLLKTSLFCKLTKEMVDMIT